MILFISDVLSDVNTTFVYVAQLYFYRKYGEHTLLKNKMVK